MTKTTLTARVGRDGKWWFVEVPELSFFTQAARLHQVEAMVLDAAALVTGRPESDFEVTLDLSGTGYAELVADFRTKSVAAADAEREAAKASRAAVARMRAEGLTVAESAALLGLSPQRVSQLAKAS